MSLRAVLHFGLGLQVRLNGLLHADDRCALKVCEDNNNVNPVTSCYPEMCGGYNVEKGFGLEALLSKGECLTAPSGLVQEIAKQLCMDHHLLFSKTVTTT